VSADLVSAFPAAAWSELSAASRAIVIPDGIFWRVPFEALPVGDGWLADRTSVTYAGSVTSLVRAPAAAPQSPAGPLLAVSSPDLPAAVRDRIASTAPGWTLRASDAADVEVRSAIAPFIDPAPVVLSGAAATEAAVRERAPAASMLHFAVPFRMNGESPLFSPMLLSSDFSAATRQTKDDDGVLETREVMNLDLHARVAVFSDGAATSMRDASPAADTVRWAWRVAGIPAIVLPRWAGDAGASSAWMNEMYKALQSGSEPDAALQRARAAMRADEDTRAPYFWAGWMLIGR
jgi:CHAT domain-containing protein